MGRLGTISSDVVAYNSKGKAAALSVDATKQMCLFNARAYNRSGGALNVGLLRRLNPAKQKIWTKVVAAYANVTAAVQAGTSTQVVTATNNDGFILQSSKRFGLVGLTVSNTATGGTYTFEYWNGSAWTTLTTEENFTNFSASGDKYLVFIPPHDWVVGDDTAATDQAMYSIRVLHTTAPGDAGNVSAMWMGQFLDYIDSLADNGVLQIMCDTELPIELDAEEGLMGYFATAAAGNLIGAAYGSK